MSKDQALQELQTLPWIGIRSAEQLWDIGICGLDDFISRSVQHMYEEVRLRCGAQVNKIFLYVLRCAMYYATHDVLEDEKLNWWYWKDLD